MDSFLPAVNQVEEQLLARSSDGSTILIKAAKEGDATCLYQVLNAFKRIVLPHEVPYHFHLHVGTSERIALTLTTLTCLVEAVNYWPFARRLHYPHCRISWS